MDIKIKNCTNCPFKVIDTDYDCVGYDTVERCNLINFVKKDQGYVNSTISVYSSYGDDIEPCQYCKDFEIIYDIYWNKFHQYNDLGVKILEEEPEFNDEKCECEKNKEEYLTKLPEFKSPEWCPLNHIKTINLSLITSEQELYSKTIQPITDIKLVEQIINSQISEKL